MLLRYAAHSFETRQRLILHSWQANFIPSLARKYPSDELTHAAPNTEFAANAAKATDTTAKIANVDADVIWRAVSDDCQALASGNIVALENRPLWSTSIPVAIAQDIELLEKLPELLGPNATLIIHWYRSWLDGKPCPFENEAGREQALKEHSFWQITDERSAEQIMDEAVEILGWDAEHAEAQSEKSQKQFIIDYLGTEVEPRTIDQIRLAFQTEGRSFVDSSLRRDLGQLTDTGDIRRVETGVYVGAGTEHIDVPGQEPAPIEAAFVDEKIVRIHSNRLPSLVGLNDSHRILRSEAERLANRLGRQAPDAAHGLDSVFAELGETIAHTQIYGVGYWAGVLNQISARLDEEVLEDAAGRFAGFINSLNLFLRQSDEWNANIQKAQQAELQSLAGSDIEVGTQEIVAQLAANEELISNEVSGPLEALNRALLDAPMYNPETAYGFYRSLANVMQAVVEVALTDGVVALKAFANNVRKNIQKEAASWTAKTILKGLAKSLLMLATGSPAIFGFLKPILRWLDDTMDDD